MSNNYQGFANDFVASSAGVQIQVRNRVLCVYTFIPHAGPYNKMLYFIDIASHQSFLYWNDTNGKNNFFGKTPVSNSTIHFMEQQLMNNPQFESDPDKSMLEAILAKASGK